MKPSLDGNDQHVEGVLYQEEFKHSDEGRILQLQKRTAERICRLQQSVRTHLMAASRHSAKGGEQWENAMSLL